MSQSTTPQIAFGIDIGGSGIKGAPVDLATGEFTAERKRVPTPGVSTPAAVTAVIRELVEGFDLPEGTPVGVAFPGPIHHGRITFIANLDESWTGVDLDQMLATELERSIRAVNDADAAGYGEALYGAARDTRGTILVTTLGTGIGSALIVDGTLVPNTELGHLEIDGFDAESRAADSARTREDLSFSQWAERLQRYYQTVEMLFSPDLIVVGGGVSKHHEQFLPLLELRTPIVPAVLRNRAGIVGAAALAAGRAL
ncbi:polyphosphate glucokinase [Flavimobilis marinus]|uniref:Polyphosphate glucokinase n=1 Tax=Flavimobilis marinus TaxID=285351 RepID=A0A1I2FUY4_9MICO|nr:ROK family protein [Flavimobilis marinus]GHG51246.1 polyphosphate glucokinase [Flavimobilis marinus]SFF08326.1 polyphosphate glucokinase [Flavimobilis marinus]